MKFFLALVGVILLICFVVAVCSGRSNITSKQEEYLKECARQKLNQRQYRDIDLD